jgi:hypothetical protein
MVCYKRKNNYWQAMHLLCNEMEVSKLSKHIFISTYWKHRNGSLYLFKNQTFLFSIIWLSCWCPTYIVLCFCFVYYSPMLPVSLDCPFLIAPSVFSNVNSQYVFIFDNMVVMCSFKMNSRLVTLWINVREHRWGNQKWTIKRNWY